MLSPDRVPDMRRRSPSRPPTTTSCAAPSRYISEHWRDQPETEAIARSRRRHRDRAASPVSPLGRAHAQGVPAGAHARPCAAHAARFRERARRLVRGRAVGTRTAARPVRHPRGDVAGRMEVGRRRADDRVRLPPLAVRHRAGDGDRARARRARLRGRRARSGRRSPTCAAAGRRPHYVEDSARTAPLAPRIFDSKLWRADRPLRVVLIGTDFEVRVWETLLQDPDGPRHHLFGHRRQDRQPTRPRARSAPRSARTRCRSWCRATACSARAATSPAITGA